MRLLFLLLFILCSYKAYALSSIRDGETEELIKEIAKPLVEAAGLSPASVKFYILQDPDLNAFVFGGQNIFLTTGLISHSDNPEVIAGVIAHELGHIKGGHIILSKNERANIEKKMIIATLLGAAAGIAAKTPEVAIGGSSISSHNSMLEYFKFSRSQESAADLTGIKLLNSAGYPSAGVVDFLNYLESQHRSFNDRTTSYLSTHPLNHDRIEFMKSKSIADPKGISKSLVTRFQRVNKKIVAFTGEPSKVISSNINKTELDNLYALSIGYYRSGNVTRALEIVEELIKIEPKNSYFHELKGQILFENKKFNPAIESYKLATTLNPKDMVIKLAYASALVRTKRDLNIAVENLEHVLVFEPTNSEAWKLHAIAKYHQGNKAEAYISSGWEKVLRGESDIAKRIIALAEFTISDADTKLKRKLRDLKDAYDVLLDFEKINAEENKYS